jgi:ATP-binding cassette, subfamily C, bacterial CydCD
VRLLDRRLLHSARAARRHISASVVLGTVAAALILVQADVLATAIARVVERSATLESITRLLLVLAAVVGGRAAVAAATEAVSQRSAVAVKSELRRKLVYHAARLGPAAPDRARVTTLAVDGLDGLDLYFSRYIPQVALAAVVPVVVIIRLFAADPLSAVIVVLTVPLIPIFMVLIGKATEVVTARRWRTLTRLAHHFLDVVSGLTTLKAFGRAKAQVGSVRGITDDYRRTTMATLRVAFLSALVLELAATLSVALVAVSVGLRLVEGHLDLTTGLLAIILAPEAYFPIREVAARFHAAADGIAAADALFEVLDTPLAPSGTVTEVPDLRDGARLVVEDAGIVHRGRDTAAPAGVSFDIGCGELVAVVGSSGAGKTSLLSAILGVMPLSSGQISLELNGRRLDLADLDRTSWQKHIAWVDQSPYLFAGSLADNVRLADRAASDTDVRAALDEAGLADMALDRIVGEGGIGLSAGEKRRVALARAILRRASLVLLDEPTAGLDAATEALVMGSIRRLADHSAVLMAAHRPGAVAMADRIVAVVATAADSEVSAP